MRVTEFLEHAAITAHLGRTGEVPNDILSYGLTELNRHYFYIYNLYPWDDAKLLNIEATTTTGILVFPQTVDYIRSVRNGSQILTPVDEVRVFHWNAGAFDDSGDPVSFIYLPRQPVLTQLAVADTLEIVSTSAADTSALGNVRIEGTVAGVDDFEEIALNGTTPVPTTKTFAIDGIREITKPKTTGRIAVRDSSSVELGTIAPWDQQGHYRRIQLVPAPTASTTVKIIAIRKLQPLVSDDDSIIIPEVESGLLDMLIASMFRLAKDHVSAGQYMKMGLDAVKAGAFIEKEMQDKDLRSAPASGSFGDLGASSAVNHVSDTSVTGVG